jgi:hypothetical protein
MATIGRATPRPMATESVCFDGEDIGVEVDVVVEEAEEDRDEVEVEVEVGDWVELVMVWLAKPVTTPLLLRRTPEWLAQQLGSLSQQYDPSAHILTLGRKPVPVSKGC